MCLTILRHNRKPHVFNLGQKVFLLVSHDNKTLSTDKCTKLTPQFCEPSMWSSNALAHQPITSLFLTMLESIHFHVSCLILLLDFGDNTIIVEIMATSHDLTSKSHVQTQFSMLKQNVYVLNNPRA